LDQTTLQTEETETTGPSIIGLPVTDRPSGFNVLKLLKKQTMHLYNKLVCFKVEHIFIIVQLMRVRLGTYAEVLALLTIIRLM
jgi:hypothetical protein